MKMVVGHGTKLVFEDAVSQAISQCEELLGGKPAKAGIVYTSFMDVEYGVMLDAINRAFPGIRLIGGTTDGELSSHTGFSEQSVVLTLFSSDSVDFVASVGREYSSDPFGVAKAAADEAMAGADEAPRLCLAIPDGLTTIGSPVVESLRAAMGDVPVFGGTAGDRFRLEKTYQFFDGEVVTDSVVLLFLYGPVVYSSGVSSGWTPIGKQHEIEGAEGNVVRKIGQWTALEFYEHYLGPNHEVYPQFPLAVHRDDRFYLRDPLIFNEEDGSIAFVGTFPERCSVQVAEAGRDDLIEAVRDAIDDAMKGFPGSAPEAALIFSCCSRHIILGSRTKEEHGQVAESVDAAIPVSGFYTYGEIGPLVNGGPTEYHNDAFVLLLLGEA